MINAYLGNQVWSEHCRGRSVPEIANKLGLPTDEVRRRITDIWLDDKLDLRKIKQQRERKPIDWLDMQKGFENDRDEGSDDGDRRADHQDGGDEG